MIGSGGRDAAGRISTATPSPSGGSCQHPPGWKVGIVEILHGSFGRLERHLGTPFFAQQCHIVIWVGDATLLLLLYLMLLLLLLLLLLLDMMSMMKRLQDMPNVFGLMSLATGKVDIHPPSRRRFIVHVGRQGCMCPTTTTIVTTTKELLEVSLFVLAQISSRMLRPGARLCCTIDPTNPRRSCPGRIQFVPSIECPQSEHVCS